MPIYEYACKICDHELEVIQSIKASPLTQCPACNNDSLRKKLSAAAFHLKGTGWYETDFKNKKSDDKKSKQTESEDSKKDDTKQVETKSSDKKTADASKSSSSAQTAT